MTLPRLLGVLAVLTALGVATLPSAFAADGSFQPNCLGSAKLGENRADNEVALQVRLQHRDRGLLDHHAEQAGRLLRHRAGRAHTGRRCGARRGLRLLRRDPGRRDRMWRQGLGLEPGERRR